MVSQQRPYSPSNKGALAVLVPEVAGRNSKSSQFTNHLRPTLKGKGKAIPLQAWTGPEDSRRLRLTDFKTVGT